MLAYAQKHKYQESHKQSCPSFEGHDCLLITRETGETGEAREARKSREAGKKIFFRTCACVCAYFFVPLRAIM